MKDLCKWLMRQFKNSVSLRYLTTVSSFVLVVQLIFSLLQIQRNQARQMEILHKQVQSNTNFIRDIAPETIFNLDFLYLETLMQQTAKETDVVYSVIINQNGKALTRYLNHEHPLIKSVIQNTDTPQDDILTLLATVDRLPLVHKKQVSIASYGQPLGEVHIGFSTQRVRSEGFRAAVNSIITALSVSLLLAVLTILLFNRQVHGPLKSLRKFAHGFEEGNLSQRIQIRYPDEIGQVGRALNRMADQLQENLVGLAKARDQAIAANKAKSKFLANMSHELRTPLNAILGFSELMTYESDTTPAQKRNLEIINNSGEHLLSLINDILEMAKIESGQASIESIAFDLHPDEGDAPTATAENAIPPFKAVSAEDIRAQIAAMPQDWLTQIHEAAVQLDHEKTSTLIQQIMDSHHELAMQLHTWVTNFRFDKITNYTTDILGLT
ncbi:histidine kinase dimerization/phospho-acceptor domain-containing protein [Leptothoe sp. ISB3NOV94-8A]